MRIERMERTSAKHTKIVATELSTTERGVTATPYPTNKPRMIRKSRKEKQIASASLQ
jgi:hypothetical protein